jgi:hypothetical protein
VNDWGFLFNKMVIKIAFIHFYSLLILKRGRPLKKKRGKLQKKRKKKCFKKMKRKEKKSSSKQQLALDSCFASGKEQKQWILIDLVFYL